jgi:outer membrane protein OmpA-like peptidoglycan-associated protein/tetratricopeptide (TPR) repeat protein
MHIKKFIKENTLTTSWLKTIACMLFFFASSTILKGQRGDCKEIKNQAAIKLFQEAVIKPSHKYREAISLLEQAIILQKNYVDAYYNLAEISYLQAIKTPINSNEIGELDDFYNEAEKGFLKVIELCPSYDYYNAFYYLGDFYYSTREFEKANGFLETFLEHNSEGSVHYKEAIKMVKNIGYYLELLNNPVPFKPTPLKDVCTDNDEYLPLISPDEEMLFYSRRYKVNPNTAYEKYIEELVFSSRNWDDSSTFKFVRGIPLDEPFNDGRNQGGATITIDNNHLFITICEYERANYTSFKNCDIFTSDNIKNEWSPLRRLGKTINGKNTFEGMPSITADGKVLFFASAREGGYGGIDIYKSEKQKNGLWGEALNLGPVINTPGDDKTPFIHSDSQTLYFATNGRLGLGGFDVFYSQYNGFGQWSEPQNMGYPINTENDELGLIVSANGKRIFFSSKSFNEDGNWDIYSAELYEQARPKKVLFVKGKLTDQEGREVTDAKVGIKGVKSNETTEGLVDSYSGKYAVAVPVKKDEDYLLTVKKDKYFFDSKLIDPDDDEYEPPTTIDFKIGKIEKGKPVRLQNVNFEYGSHKLNEISKANINQLVEFMKVNKKIRIMLHGHTDNRGTPDFNQALSQLRVQSVRNYMRKQGINSDRISYRGFGEKKPLATNATKKGRKINRRVEFIVK